MVAGEGYCSAARIGKQEATAVRAKGKGVLRMVGGHTISLLEESCLPTLLNMTFGVQAKL
jgi:hypothetical protein